MKFQKGFTLIELLVVVAIISLLSSVILASIGSARDRARYAKFDNEFLQLRTAMELYRAENSGNYPVEVTSFDTIENVISALEASGHYSAGSITMPQGYTFNTVYPASLINDDGRGVVTCGSRTESGGNYALFFYTQTSAPSSKLPSMFYNGLSVDTPGSSYYHCLEI